MDQLRAERQIKLILVTFRTERRRRDGATMLRFLDRAEAILASLEPRIQDHPSVLRLLRDARRELRRGQDLPRRGLGKQPIDRRRELGNGERLH